ncbi:MAG: glycosyltransferase [Planctomycetes bacterium]|nr:glycosyltransferase [Planctomycetota bacterium]
MKILYIGDYLEGKQAVGGSTLYQTSLANGISKTDEVYFLGYGGLDRTGKCYVTFKKRSRISIYSVVNSPFLDYTNCDPKLFVECQQVHDLFLKVISKVKPDIIHIHHLSFPISIIDSIGIPIITTIHNYMHVCSQINLMYNGIERCSDFEDGRKCTKCSTPVFAVNEQYFKYVRFKTFIERHRIGFLDDFAKPIVRIFHDNNAGENRNITDFHSEFSAEDFVDRRTHLLASLNKMTFIHCSSSYLMRYLASYGVNKSKLRLIPMTAESLNHVKPKTLCEMKYPVTFGYFGGANVNKGIDILIPAFRKLDKQRARLILSGPGVKKVQVSVGDLNIMINSNLSNINEIFSKIDVGIVPSVWDETFGIIGIELNNARIPIIGSNIGGIPQWLENGVNGFLTEPGNIDDLTAKMQMFVDDPSLIARFQLKMIPWKRMDDHIKEIQALYTEALNSLVASTRI